jgi:nitrogen fixation protein FixH
MTARPQPTARPRSWWPLGIVVGLGIVFVANGIMITKALENPSAPAAEDHYVESEHYEEVLTERKAAAALGWTVDVEACPEGFDDGCVVTLTVTDRDGEPVTGLAGSVTATRADTTDLDRNGGFEESASGRYRTVLDLGDDGYYLFELRLTGHETPWVGERRIQIDRGKNRA